MNLIWIHFSMFIIPNVIRVFLKFFGSVLADFPRRVISHPYCYVHYDVLDTTCVIGCLMNDILILFLCLLSRMLFGLFLTSFGSVLYDFPTSILAIAMCLFISSNIIRGFLSSCYRFSTLRFPREFQATLSHEQAPQVHVTASLIR